MSNHKESELAARYKDTREQFAKEHHVLAEKFSKVRKQVADLASVMQAQAIFLSIFENEGEKDLERTCGLLGLWKTVADRWINGWNHKPAYHHFAEAIGQIKEGKSTWRTKYPEYRLALYHLLTNSDLDLTNGTDVSEMRGKKYQDLVLVSVTETPLIRPATEEEALLAAPPTSTTLEILQRGPEEWLNRLRSGKPGTRAKD